MIAGSPIIAGRSLMPEAAIAIEAVPVPDALSDIGERPILADGNESTGHMARLASLEAENAELRRVALRNMRLLKREVMPLLATAWRAGQRGGRDGAEDFASSVSSAQLSRVTREVLGLIDDTVIKAAVHPAADRVETHDLGKIARRVIAEDRGEIRLSRGHFRIGQLPVLRVREPLISMLFAELFVNAVRNARPGQVPEIVVKATRDARGNPVVRMTEAGIPLSSRKQAMAGKGLQGPAGQEVYAWSLCQRLAEKSGATFGISETETGCVQISIRFPRHLAECGH